jgi:hypothetical protein
MLPWVLMGLCAVLARAQLGTWVFVAMACWRQVLVLTVLRYRSHC